MAKRWSKYPGITSSFGTSSFHTFIRSFTKPLKLGYPFNDHWPLTTHTIIKFTTAFFKINIYLDLIFLLLPSIAQKIWSGYIFRKAFGITYIMAINIQAIPKSFWIVPYTSYQCL